MSVLLAPSMMNCGFSQISCRREENRESVRFSSLEMTFLLICLTVWGHDPETESGLDEALRLIQTIPLGSCCRSPPTLTLYSLKVSDNVLSAEKPCLTIPALSRLADSPSVFNVSEGDFRFLLCLHPFPFLFKNSQGRNEIVSYCLRTPWQQTAVRQQCDRIWEAH